MSTEISWVFEAAIKPDDLDEYGALAREISADNQAAEPGQEIFEWFVDDQDVHIYERYRTRPSPWPTSSDSWRTSVPSS